MPTVQGGISFDSLKQDTDFMAASEADQIQYLNEVFLPKSDPEFAKAPLAERQQYIKEAVLPNLKIRGLSTQQPQASPLGGFQNVANQIDQVIQPAKDIQNAFFASNLYNNAQALKGATAGYVDLAPSVEQLVGPVPQPVKDLGWAPEFAGMALPLGGISKGVKAATMGLGSGLPAQALRVAGDLGIYEALRRREDAPVFSPQQLDPMGRLQSGLQGAVTGAAFPLAGNLLGKGASKFAQLFNPESAPLRVATSKEAELAARGADQVAKFDQAKNIMQLYARAFQEAEQANPSALRDNPISKAQRLNVHNSLEDLARQAQNGQVELSEKEIAYLAGKLKAFRSDAVSKSQVSASKNFLQSIQKRQGLLNEQKAKIQLTKGQSNAQGAQKTGAFSGNIEQAQGQGALVGRVETNSPFSALEEKAAKPTGKTVQELLDSKPAQLTQAEQDVRANLKVVRNAEVVDAQKGLLRQSAINEKTDLPYEAIAHLVEDKALGSKLEEIAKGDLSGRVEYQAEIVGRSDKAVTVTKAGNVKSATTTFKPTSFGISTRIENIEDIPVNPKTGKPYGKDSKVVQGLIEDGTLKVKQYPLAKGYNEQGHFVTLHINKSPEGSQILKIGKIVESHFNGEYANVYTGPKEFKAADVLSRGARTESGFVKTSEAMTNAQIFAKLLEPDLIQQFSPKIQKLIKGAKKLSRFDDYTLKTILKEIQKEKEQLAIFCRTFGL